jgi:hypothetical protein
MRTHSSPPQSEGNANHVSVQLTTTSKPRCDWPEEDVIQLISFLINNQPKGADRATFTSSPLEHCLSAHGVDLQKWCSKDSQGML